MRTLVFTFLAALTVSSAHAEVVASQTVEKEIVVNENGTDKLKRVTAEKVAPGEQVIYTLRFENKGAEPAEKLDLVMPVPAEVTYVEGSISGMAANVTFSADGGETYVARGRLTIEEGGEARPATGNEITHIRWSLDDPLAPTTAGEVSYRGILN